MRSGRKAAYNEHRKMRETDNMCGIIGYTGKDNAEKIMLDALELLEYRGYDSAGIALLNKGRTHPKESGKSKGTAGAVRKRKAPGAVRYRPYPVGHPRRGVR